MGRRIGICGTIIMGKNVLVKFNMDHRDDMVKFLKSLWKEVPQPCPLCGGKIDYLHKKAKKSNCDWVCTACGERFDTIKIVEQVNE